MNKTKHPTKERFVIRHCLAAMLLTILYVCPAYSQVLCPPPTDSYPLPQIPAFEADDEMIRYTYQIFSTTRPNVTPSHNTISAVFFVYETITRFKSNATEGPPTYGRFKGFQSGTCIRGCPENQYLISCEIGEGFEYIYDRSYAEWQIRDGCGNGDSGYYILFTDGTSDFCETYIPAHPEWPPCVRVTPLTSIFTSYTHWNAPMESHVIPGGWWTQGSGLWFHVDNYDGLIRSAGNKACFELVLELTPGMTPPLFRRYRLPECCPPAAVWHQVKAAAQPILLFSMAALRMT
ncbi:MAG: hypothetical protein H0X66_06655 [Verrucomicrobia bacterium]|nr:hypothetical protein [Verrucomicrobiota bacterium]